MSKFVLKTIQAVKGRQIFKQLIIVPDEMDIVRLQQHIHQTEQEGGEVDMQGQLDIYEAGLEEKYKACFERIIGNMNRVSNLQSLPQDKFKDVTTNKSPATEYEYKYGDLRAWATKIPNGQLFVHGGYKNDQKAGFRQFRSLVIQYIKQQNN